MSKILALTGNQTCAYAMRQINPDVVAIYPITPQTDIAEQFTEYVADNLVDTELVAAESEHSALSCCISAAAAGARTLTATSAQGLALMWEMLYIASGLRLPMVLINVNRTLSAPINIHCDHSDSMGARDCGWIQLYSENSQEAYDNIIQAVKIGENKDVLLPVMVNLDGFITSHCLERVEVLEDEVVRKFIGEYKSLYSLLDVDNPKTFGPFDGLGGYYFEHKKNQIEAMERARKVILDVAAEFEKISNRKYSFFEEYKLADAEVAIIVMNSAVGTCRVVVDELREKGYPVGLIKLRCYRPFPQDELSSVLSRLKAVGILDRATCPGILGGPVFCDVKASLYDRGIFANIINFIYGLGGREFTPEHAKEAILKLFDVVKKGRIENYLNYLGLRRLKE